MEVYEDFKLMISNCLQYNVIREDIKRLANKFSKSIDTEWGNFQKECFKEGLDWEDTLTIT
jgi:hypothetical protein